MGSTPIALPTAQQAPLCADFARANEVDPGGTALAPDVVVLIELDEPWPKPVGKHEAMVELVQAAQARPETIRLLAAVPMTDAPRRVIAFRPTPTGATRSERLLCVDPVAALHEALDDASPAVESASDGPTAMLICTQGSHDVCCGTQGVAFAEWVEQNSDVEVFRISHTGGHKFAPTAMTLPDGRMWAYLDQPSVEQILDRRDASSIAKKCRGWWGAPKGAAQVAERAVFAELGFQVDALERSVTVLEPPADETTSKSFVTVRVGGRGFDVVVEPGREIPTIACGTPGGQPVKPSIEWVVVEGPTER